MSDDLTVVLLLPSALAPPFVASGPEPAEMLVEELSPLAAAAPELALAVFVTDPCACVAPDADAPPPAFAPLAALVASALADVELPPFCPAPTVPPLPAEAAPLL